MTTATLTRPTDTSYKPKHANRYSMEPIDPADALAGLVPSRNGKHATTDRRIYGSTWRNDYAEAKQADIFHLPLPGRGLRRA